MNVTTCNAPSIIAACCVLHNICEIHGEGLDEAWQNELYESTALVQPAGQLNGEIGLEGAASIRAALARYFVNNHQVFIINYMYLLTYIHIRICVYN